MVLSKSDKSFINSLKHKKYRLKNKLFVAEGVKVIHELLKSKFILESLYATKNWCATEYSLNRNKLYTINKQELKSISSLKEPNQVLGIFRFFEEPKFSSNTTKTLILDSIRDPENLGTIIRIADWYGIQYIVCSTDCVDIYNPKVIQASMGSIANVSIIYNNLPQFIKKNININFYTTSLKGKNINNPKFKFKFPLAIIIGNEANGVSTNVSNLTNYSIFLERYGKAQSLNAATATAVFLDRISIASKYL